MAVTPSPASAAAKRWQSAERRRPAAIGVEMSTATKMLASSKRCLSVSFQGESFSMPISKSKSTSSPNLRKATPERKRTTPFSTTPRKEGDKLQIDSVKSMSRSVDLGSVKKTLNGRYGINRIQHPGELQNSKLLSANSLNRSISTSESTTSETESVSSDNNYSPKDNGNVSQTRAGSRGVIVPARFLQETNNRLRRFPDPSSPLSRSNSLKAIVSSSPRGNLLSRGLSPMRHSRPSTPLVLEKSSPSRGMASPSRVRNATMGSSILCFSADVRRGKVNENKIGDAHLLRLLYNRQLQWRFANAREEAALSV